MKQRVEALGRRSVDGMESTSNQWELELQASMKKLNEIPLGKENNVFNENDKTFNKLESIENKSKMEKLMKDNDNVKVDSQPGKFSLSYQGWQSLTQSPINSIFSKSKDALKNSISKSLSNSPVNMKQFSFSRAKLERTQSIEKPIVDKEDKESRKNTKNCDNLDVQCGISSLETSKIDISQSEVENSQNTCEDDVNSRIEKISDDIEKVQKERVLDKNFTTHSLSSSPIKRNLLLSSKSTKSLDIARESLNSNRDFKKPNCPSKELPLLSIFRNSLSKDKSCSMIDLGDKQNLKSLFENSSNKNLQTVSVERLANARHKLMCNDNCDLKPETQ